LNRFERVLSAALILNVLNTGYLSWRYIALHAGWVTPGTGLCSWTAGIDCDRVLMTPQARAFWFPNALLGFGFSLGCLVWWMAGTRLGPAYRRHIIRSLVCICVGQFLLWPALWAIAFSRDMLSP
jgi:uncharacterized membrane protein